MENHSIIFLHADLQNSSALEKIHKSFASKDHLIFTYDYPGHGKAPFEKKEHIEILDEFLKENNITKPIFVGHSFGGALATKYILEKNNASALILINAPITNPEDFNPDMDWEGTCDYLKKTSEEKFKNQEFIDYSKLENPTEEEIREIGLATTSKEGYIQNLDFLKQLPNKKELSNINIPTLSISSNTDPLFLKNYASECTSNMPNAKLIKIDESHNAPILNPEKIIDIIDKNYEFLLGQ